MFFRVFGLPGRATEPNGLNGSVTLTTESELIVGGCECLTPCLENPDTLKRQAMAKTDEALERASQQSGRDQQGCTCIVEARLWYRANQQCRGLGALRAANTCLCWVQME
jgi:hypothetical protein